MPQPARQRRGPEGGPGGALVRWKKIQQPSAVKTNRQLVLPPDLTFQQEIQHFSLLLAAKLIGIEANRGPKGAKLN